MYDVIRIVYFGLYIFMRFFSIDGFSKVLNWERYLEVVVDVRVLLFFCENNVDINNGELGNKELYKYFIEDYNICKIMWRF